MLPRNWESTLDSLLSWVLDGRDEKEKRGRNTIVSECKRVAYLQWIALCYSTYTYEAQFST
jgi:hypothetical protein